MSGQHYCLRWNNYQSNMTSVFHQLLQTEAFVDVTLACNDLSLKAHKVVLSACSSYFQKLLMENPCKHPTIIMPQDVGYADLKFIIEFVYKGEIDVSQTELQSLLRTADQLKIKGLCESSDTEAEKNNNTATDLSPHFLLHNKNLTKIRKSSSPKQLRPPPPQDRSPDNINRKRKHNQPHLEDNNTTNKENKEDNVDNTIEDGEGGEGSSGEEENDNDMPAALNDHHNKRNTTEDEKTSSEQTKPLNMSSHGTITQTIFSQFGVDTDDFPPEPPAPSAIPVGHVDMQEHSPTRTLLTNTIHRTDISDSNIKFSEIKKECVADIKFETLRSYDQDSLLDMESHDMSGPDHSMDSHDDDQSMHNMMVTPELMGMLPGVSNRLDLSSNEVPALKNNGHSDNMPHTPRSHGGGPKTWTQEDMDMALDALRNHNMSLTKASATYGIPSTTLWQRAHRLGIDTPKKEGPTKSWTEENLNNALEALRTGTISANKASKAYGKSTTLRTKPRAHKLGKDTPRKDGPGKSWTEENLNKALEALRSGTISANKASKAYGIPSSTLYKIARREGIRLAAPFNAAPTTWTPEDLEKALESIRSGQTSVQKASTEFGIPTGTLYGRCKREGIELSRSNPTPWSEDAMGEALEAVRLGHMSINQAAIHYNLPYSSLYGRFKRGLKYDSDGIEPNSDSQSHMDGHSFGMDYLTTTSTAHQQHVQYQNHTNS